jgi:hypothetical protein
VADDQRPLSELVAQGWEVHGFTAGPSEHGMGFAHTFLLRRQRQHKVLVVWRKAFGGGVASKELEV